MNRAFAIAFCILAFTPAVAFAQAVNGGTTTFNAQITAQPATTFQRNGIFGCNLNGSYTMSVGSMSAMGGAYVPVNDAAVTLNTGYLVYKECVLREVIDAERMKATADILNAQTQAMQSGRVVALDGVNYQLPQYVVNPAREMQQVRNLVVRKLYQNGYFNGINPAIKNDVTQALIQGYAQEVAHPEGDFSCDYGDLQNALDGNPQSVQEALSNLIIPGCDPISTYNITSSQLSAAADAMANYQLDQWNWGNGFYQRQTDPSDPFSDNTTPSSLVYGGYLPVYNSSFTQLQNASDIGQIVGDTFARVSTYALSSSGGFAGLTQSPGGSQPSYLQQVVGETGGNVINSAIYTAALNLNGAIQATQLYLNALQTIAQYVGQAIDSPSAPSIRSAERSCWNVVIQNVCASGTLKPDGTCTAQGSCTTTTDPNTGLPTQTCTTGEKLKVATSSYPFAQEAIDAQIRATASSTIAQYDAASSTMAALRQLASQLTGAMSQSAQLSAIQATESYLQAHPAKTPTDLQSVQSAALQIQQQMAQIVQTTINNWTGNPNNNQPSSDLSWDGSIYPGVGWCNATTNTNGGKATIQKWVDAWKQ